MSRAAARRAAARGNGWYGFFTDPAATARSLAWIREDVDAGLRPPELGALEISVTPPAPLSAEALKAYRELGVHRIIGTTRARDVQGLLAFVDELARLGERS
jgi:hypothetical protein